MPRDSSGLARDRGVPAMFMRGGTSKGLMFLQADLPPREHWDALFLSAMGSPDPNGRQLDGMGGGLSSLSKVCVVGPSSRPDADVDYTFGQVMIDQARVDYGGNCGNMSSAVGPFAVLRGLVRVPDDGPALVRIHNTNTGKVIHAGFAMAGGLPVFHGELALPGVAGTGAPIRLDFLDPGGAATGALLPTGNVVDSLAVPGLGSVQVSMVDAANACVFVRAADLGLRGTEMPQQIEADAGLMARLAAIREAASMAMGIAKTPEAARASRAVPFVGYVSPAQAAPTLSGQPLRAEDMDISARMLSSGQPHRALPLTASLCLAVAAALPGTVVHESARAGGGDVLRIGMPSGVLQVGAELVSTPAGWQARRGVFYRTARPLFDGRVFATA